MPAKFCALLNPAACPPTLVPPACPALVLLARPALVLVGVCFHWLHVVLVCIGYMLWYVCFGCSFQFVCIVSICWLACIGCSLGRTCWFLLGCLCLYGISFSWLACIGCSLGRTCWFLVGRLCLYSISFSTLDISTCAPERSVSKRAEIPDTRGV